MAYPNAPGMQGAGTAASLMQPFFNSAEQQAKRTGTLDRQKGLFGFIKQDCGEDDIFVLPSDVAGGVLPPVGTRVSYNAIVDPKTGRPRAAEVELEGARALDAQYDGSEFNLAQSQGQPQLFLPPPMQDAQQGGFAGGQEVLDFNALSGQNGFQPAAPIRADGKRTGTMARESGNFGFIQQDNGEGELFILPVESLGWKLPQVGVRVAYRVFVDPKTGSQRAEDVELEHSDQSNHLAFASDQGLYGGAGANANHAAQVGADQFSQVQAAAADNANWRTGTMDRRKGPFGFIKQDCGEADIFMLPSLSFNNELPPEGSRITYKVLVDPKTGLARADDVQLLQGEAAATAPSVGHLAAIGLPALAKSLSFDQAPANGQGQVVSQSALPAVNAGGEQRTGTMARQSTGFGFILQDCGEEDVFVLPPESFGFQLPQIGTRLRYTVVIDPKTGRPRAEDVQPEGGSFLDASSTALALLPPAIVPALLASRTSRSVPVQTKKISDDKWQVGDERAGTFARIRGNFGFIKQDCGEDDLFVLPNCEAFGGQLPPIGTRVTYSVIVDAKTGRARAESVQPEDCYPESTSYGVAQLPGVGADVKSHPY